LNGENKMWVDRAQRKVEERQNYCVQKVVYE